MPFFSNAQGVEVHDSLMMDVQGDFFQAGGDILIQHEDPLYRILYPEIAKGAAYNSKERDPPPRCQPGTRQAILEEIRLWTRGREETTGGGSIMWLQGPAGAGKSAIAQTICESHHNQLAASFFFSREDSFREKLDHFATTIAFQLAMSGSDLLRNRITQTVKKDPLVVHSAPLVQVEHLIIRPLLSLFANESRTGNASPFLVVIDGLDECRGNPRQNQLLAVLFDLIRVHRLPLCIFIVSRPEPHIKHAFDTANFGKDQCRILSLRGDHQSRKDVLLYLRESFKTICNAERHLAIMESVRKPWPSDSIITSIARKSGGYFIYASTILKFIDEEYYSPIERLKQVVNESSPSNLEAFANLDKLYKQVLSTCPKPATLRMILGSILLCPRHFHIWWSSQPSIDRCALQLGLLPGEVELTLRGLHSLLSLQKHFDTGVTYISLAHASLEDFFLNKERAGPFFIDAQEHHKSVATACWRYFSCSLDTIDSEYVETVTFSTRREVDYRRSFRTHFDEIMDKSQIIDAMKGANELTWAPLIHSFNGRLVESQIMLPEMVIHVVDTLKDFTPLPGDLIYELLSLEGAIYFDHLSLQSMHNVRFIEGVWAMGKMEYGALSVRISPDNAEKAEFMQISRSTRKAYVARWEDFLEVPRSFHSVHIAEYLLCIRPRLTQRFIQFMTNPRRSGNLFASQGTCHTRLALCCIKVLTSGMCTRNKPFSDYIRVNFAKHLSCAPSAADQVLAYLRALDFDVKFSELAQARYLSHIRTNIMMVLTWLKSLPEPPMDIILPWKVFYDTRLEGKCHRTPGLQYSWESRPQEHDHMDVT